MVYNILVVVGFVLWFVIRVGRRSGVSNADRQRKLAGDEVVPNAGVSIDRATILLAPAEDVWPWIVQLGKQRAGWYAPRWIEALFPAKKRGAWQIIPKFQSVQVGDVHPDWGPGSLQVLQLQANRHIVYGSIKGKGSAAKRDVFLFSWAIIIEPVSTTQSRLYIRLRWKRGGNPLTMLFGFVFGGFFDYLTIIIMFAGLKQRLRKASH